MPVARVRLLPYTLPLRAPWHGARARMDRRAGWLVAVNDDEGRTGYGDCSPPPSSDSHAHTQARAALARISHAWPGQPPESALAALDAKAAVFPAARCALETALLDLSAQRRGVSLAAWLNPDAGREVRINASLGRLDATFAERTRAALAAGYSVLKIKVGAFPMEDELEQLHALARSLRGAPQGDFLAGAPQGDFLPGTPQSPKGTSFRAGGFLPGVPQGDFLLGTVRLRLRLDANRAWSLPQAQRFVAAVSDLPVEALEEPLADAGPETFFALQEQAAFALALDESLPLWLARHRAQALKVRRWVLKPTCLGGLRRCLALAQDGARAGVETVITTTVDSAAGVLACLHLAAALDNGIAHGLATSEWLARDLAPLPPAHRGRLALPPHPGLGLRPFADVLHAEVGAPQ